MPTFFPIALLLLTALTPLCLSARPEATDDSRLKMYYGLAEGHYLSGNFPAANKIIQEILRLDPKHRQALELKARLLLEGNPEASATAATTVTLRAIDASLSETTDSASDEASKLRLARARLLARSGETEAAIQALQSLTRQEPGNLEATLTLVALYASVDRWQSVTQLIPAIAAQPTLVDVALYLEGRTAFASGRIGRARAKFEAALEKQPARANRLSPSLYFYRSECLDALKRPEEARVDLLKAIDSGFRPETNDEALSAARALLRHNAPAHAVALLKPLPSINSPMIQKLGTCLDALTGRKTPPHLPSARSMNPFVLIPIKASRLPFAPACCVKSMTCQVPLLTMKKRSSLILKTLPFAMPTDLLCFNWSKSLLLLRH